MFISLIELKSSIKKEYRCKFEIDRLPYSKRSVEQRIKLPKVSFQCILKDYRNILSCRLLTFTSYKAFKKTEGGPDLVSLSHFLHDF